jgi:hypothetical protein
MNAPKLLLDVTGKKIQTLTFLQKATSCFFLKLGIGQVNKHLTP